MQQKPETRYIKTCFCWKENVFCRENFLRVYQEGKKFIKTVNMTINLWENYL